MLSGFRFRLRSKLPLFGLIILLNIKTVKLTLFKLKLKNYKSGCLGSFECQIISKFGHLIQQKYN